MSFNVKLSDDDYYNHAYNYYSLIDEQKKRHKSTYFPHVFRPNSLSRELREQSEKDHLRQIRREVQGRQAYEEELRQLKDRFASRHPKYHSP